MTSEFRMARVAQVVCAVPWLLPVPLQPFTSSLRLYSRLQRVNWSVRFDAVSDSVAIAKNITNVTRPMPRQLTSEYYYQNKILCIIIITKLIINATEN